MADLTGLEQQRQALEASLQKLPQGLKYWQTYEAECEGLKEEFLDAPPPIDDVKVIEIAKSYDGELMTEKIVLELAGLDKGRLRPFNQILRDLEHRQEYMRKNIETLQRQFFDVENRLETFDFAASRDIDTGLPLTEIEEELDDDDNVISGRVHSADQSKSQLLESLKKAGITGGELDGGWKAEQQLKPAITKASPPIPSNPALAPVPMKRTRSTSDSNSGGDAAHSFESPRPPIRKKSVSFTVDTKAAPEILRLESEDGKKTVSFAEKVAVAPAAPPPDPRTVQFSPKVEEIPPQPASPEISAATKPGAEDTEKQKDLRASFKPGDRVKTINDDDEVVSEDVVIPDDETEEDAQARREMLQYHLHEVGHVVAQMDLDAGDGYSDDENDQDDDTSSHFTGSTHLDEEDTPYTSGLSDEEDEDEHGRTKGKVLSDEYRKQMEEMQQRLIGNMGPAPQNEDIADLYPEMIAKDVRKLVIRDKRSSVSSASSESSEKKSGSRKRVSFAHGLDVAEPGSPPLKAQKVDATDAHVPVADAVFERRSSATSHSMPTQNTPLKASRFRTTRAMQSGEEAVASPDLSMDVDDTDEYDGTPLGPPGKTLVDLLVERDSLATNQSQAPSAQRSADIVAERRQLAAEYYRRRNDIVRQQGGFKVDRDEEEELGELMEERDGKLKKVSRFKAARIKP
ncbi:hypothetical protein LTR02_002402 [Friedmanniomyces endolithicus]|nr:hypothetical protein LTR94_003241 [Friedmanniomyces endolithicus]KAK0805172.1 hypothetical protein LTR59_004113 [Friedmanniomyces endolithicus]KAK0814449.1 hypothetical protein LTR38_002739 [Friedmanniomyces endolithicus]KAK0818401.1 hypothetical protein LTR75_002714 [Friedmanniomyces endolithicus]KAK0856079.1 hypothetical protein LTR03_001487 [Friedmanniomyces endolithicus]